MHAKLQGTTEKSMQKRSKDLGKKERKERGKESRKRVCKIGSKELG